MTRLTVTILLSLAALTTIGAPFAAADEIKVGAAGEPGITYSNIRVTRIRNGELYFFTAGGEQSASVDRIQSLKLTKYPDYAKADDLLNNKNYADAATLLDQLADKVTEDWLKTLVMAKLVFALDRSGQFDKAMTRYLQLVQLDASDYIVNLVPQNLPTDADARKAAAAKLADELKLIAEPSIRDKLTTVLKALQAAPGQGPMINTGSSGGLVGGSKEAQRDVIQEQIDKKNYDAALKAIEDHLTYQNAPLSKLLYQRGLAQEGLGQNEDAAVSFMRVVIHFHAGSSEYYAPSVIEAGKMFQKMGDADHAKSLWTEAQGLVKNDPEKSKEVQQLLDSLK